MRLTPYLLLSLPLLAALAACTKHTPPAPRFSAIGHLETFDSSFSNVIASDARIEKLTDGFTWTEGPTWVHKGGYLLFTDVPENKLYRWSEDAGLSLLLSPSGYTGPDLPLLREAGANGLHAEPSGTVLLADSGTRMLARFDPVTRKKTPIATTFEGHRFNSPNDVTRRSDGAVFFTDPPYGLKGLDKSPLKELRVNGVYRLDTDGSLHLLDDSLRYPNGIALSPDGRTLYVANTDPQRPIWMAYTLDAKGAVVSKRLFADVSDLIAEDAPGLPDGMAVAADGTVFAAAPGGLMVFNSAGKRLGRIATGEVVSSCAFGNDGHTLYMTSDAMLTRVRVKALGLEFAQ